MPFEKGRSKTGGRKKGVRNKTTEKAREHFLEIMSGEITHVQAALKEIYAKDKKAYIFAMSRYFPYFLPKQIEIDATIQNNELPFKIEIEHRKKEDNPE